MKKTVLSLMLAGLMTGCTLSTQMFESKKTDYKAQSGTTDSLEMPPDLSPVQTDDRYNVPGQEKENSYLKFSKDQGGAAKSAAPVDRSGVLPPLPPVVHIERDGSQRWLVVSLPADQVWPILKDFWAGNGFSLKVDDPKIGVMETDWTENKNAVPHSMITQWVHSVVTNLFTSSVEDRYRTRIERGQAPGTTEIYLTHQGLGEVFDPNNYTGGTWVPRPEDAELENEYLVKMAEHFGVPPTQANTLVAKEPESGSKTATAKTDNKPDNADAAATAVAGRLTKNAAGQYQIHLDEPFDRAWRKVGLALDRSAFTVDDRDRAGGVYFIRFTDEQGDQAKKQEGFFSRMAFWKSADKTLDTKTYRIAVSTISGKGTTIDVLDKDEKPVDPEIARQILTLVNGQIH